MICAVSNRANDKILLARSPRHPEGVMTTLAGFVEAGETFEACVAREVLEETGVRIDEGSVRYLKSLFLFDLVSSFPYDVISWGDQCKATDQRYALSLIHI